MCLGNNMYVMTQALEEGNSSHLPQGLSILNTYTKMTTGNKQVAVVVKITIAKRVKIAQVVAAKAMPQVGVVPGMLEKLDEMQGIQRSKMSVSRERKHSSSSQTCLAWRGGQPRIELLHVPHWLNTMTSFPWNLGSWAVPNWQNMRSKSLTTSLSRRGSEESLHLWWMRSMLMWKKCWKGVWFAQAWACGALLLCWYARRMEVCTSALTFENWMWEPWRTHTCSHGYRKHQEPSWCRVLLLALKGRVLADCNGWGFKPIHCFHHGEHRILWMWTNAIQAV